MANQKKTSEILGKIFRNPDMQYGLSVFDEIKINEVLNFSEKDGKYYLQCLKRNKSLAAKPEEIVRQLMIYKLVNFYKYPIDRIDVEVDVQFGREIGLKRADIVIYRENGKSPYLMVEVKKPDVKDGLGQLKSYANATGAPILVLTDGKIQNNILRTDPNLFEDLPEIPTRFEFFETGRKNGNRFAARSFKQYADGICSQIYYE